MAIKEYFTYDGETSLSYGVRISGVNTYGAPARDVSAFSVPGRTGDLVLDNGRYPNVTLVYPCFIVDDFNDSIEAFRSFLLSHVGYARLTDTYHPDEFRLARPSAALAPQTGVRNLSGRFDVTFNCIAKRFLTSGEMATTLSASGDIVTNPTLFEATPLIRVVGYGTLGVGTDTIEIAEHEYDYIDIDCDTMDAYCGGTNCNALITVSGIDFPVLPSGATAFTWDGTITSVTIQPRWWRL